MHEYSAQIRTAKNKSCFNACCCVRLVSFNVVLRRSSKIQPQKFLAQYVANGGDYPPIEARADMHLRSATSSGPVDISLSPGSTPLRTVPQMAARNEGFTVGGLRHILFYRGRELEEAGVVVRFGRRILIDEAKFIEWLRAGNGRKIVGVAR